ncbi:MAG TPA: hypothetical protein VGZ22_13220 [Isosphaeraceae bacterium]|nr:hypothetical protein [Isosphaeraceae bacterium]
MDRDAIAKHTAQLSADDWSPFPPEERVAFAFARELTSTPGPSR